MSWLIELCYLQSYVFFVFSNLLIDLGELLIFKNGDLFSLNFGLEPDNFVEMIFFVTGEVLLAINLFLELDLSLPTFNSRCDNFY